MAGDFPMPEPDALAAIRSGLVIPAHPLALTEDRKFDQRRQRALARYYHAAGAGGLAVAVHTTQFAIRDPAVNLLQPVLELAAETIRSEDEKTNRRTVLIAGICGQSTQAVHEARLARRLGYDAGLLSLSALTTADENALIAHCESVAHEIPLFGFYLQPAVGGRILSQPFWERFTEIPNVVGIKIAPFNRYQTWDVIRAVALSGRANEIALYTGNDDNIVVDLLTEYALPLSNRTERLRIVGGLLGHWACWTRAAANLHQQCREAAASGSIPAALLTRAAEVTDCNAALFDAANHFKGCIAGIQEVLRRQGLLSNRHCLDPAEDLSPGQSQAIDRACQNYPHLQDNDFVARNLEEWLAD